jgi:hypothetical protein
VTAAPAALTMPAVVVVAMPVVVEAAMELLTLRHLPGLTERAASAWAALPSEMERPHQRAAFQRGADGRAGRD